MIDAAQHSGGARCRATVGRPRAGILLAAALLLFAASGCEWLRAVDPLPRVEIVAPAVVRPGELVPVVVRVLPKLGETGRAFPPELGVDPLRTLRVELTGEVLAPSVVSIKKGVGSVTTRVEGTGTGFLGVEGMLGARRIEVVDALPAEAYAGTLAGTVRWSSGVERHVTGDLVVPAGSELVIEAGTRVLLGDKVNLHVDGRLRVEGTPEAPVLFAPIAAGTPWGGLVVKGEAHVERSFFTGGGADEERRFGHSYSQPVIYAEGAEVTLREVYLLDNVGKGLGGMHALLSLERGLITRCDTGGEFSWSRVHIDRSHVLDIPNDDGIFVDDDNDGFYFYEVHRSGAPSWVDNTVIMTGKDDAIDHNGAQLEVRNSWLEGFTHECVAASNTNAVRIFNTVVRGCGQGIEAGYGAPTVVVEHSVVVDNGVGVRFGDDYEAETLGKITVTHSILYDNDDNILNFSRYLGAAYEGGIVASYTITNDSAYLACPGCSAGAPRFDAHYYLRPGSPGQGAGAGGADLGLIRQP